MKKPWDRGGLRTYLLVLALVLGRADQRTVLCGLPLLFCGLVLHIWAKGCLDQDRVVAQAGPYRFVRHPFYAANLLVDESIAVMSGSALLMALLPLWWAAVYLPAMRREERHLAELFPAVYRAYRERVSMLLPLRRPLPASNAGFSWRNPNIVADTVIPRALRMCALPLLLVVVHTLRADGLRTFGEGYGLASLPVAALVLAYGLSWELAHHLKRRKRILPAALGTVGGRLGVAVSVLALACLSHEWEVESDVGLPVVGALLIAVSIALRSLQTLGRSSTSAQLAAEGLALTAAVVLCEVLWLAPAPLLFYAGLMLDGRAAAHTVTAARDQRPRIGRLLHWRVYEFVLTSGMVIALAKEFVL